MQNEELVPMLTSMLEFLIAQIREERKQTRISQQDEWQLQVLLWQSARRSRRLERIAAALSDLDAQLIAASELNLS